MLDGCERQEPLCRHCKERLARRPRGLCARCYEKPAVRHLYPSVSKYAPRKWSQDINGGYALPATATTARPGTADKLDVLTDRAALEIALWHPNDARLT